MTTQSTQRRETKQSQKRNLPIATLGGCSGEVVEGEGKGEVGRDVVDD